MSDYLNFAYAALDNPTGVSVPASAPLNCLSDRKETDIGKYGCDFADALRIFGSLLLPAGEQHDSP